MLTSGRAFPAGAALAVLTVIGLAPLSRVARADDAAARAAAKARLEKGADLLVTHGYTAALLEFEDAYRIFPSPKIFFDIGLANVGLNRNPDALRAFQRFLGEAIDASPVTVARAKAQIEALLPRVAIVDIACPTADTEILVDDRSVGRTPLAGPVYLDPGQHGLTARAKERDAPFVTTFSVTAGARTTVLVPAGAGPVAPLPVAAAESPRAALPPPSPSHAAPPTLVDSPSAADSSAPSLYRRPWFWGAVAGVLVAAGVTLWLTADRSTKYPTSSLGQMSF